MTRLKYLLVLDYEATCGPSIPRDSMEIIEYPICVVDIASKEIIDEFHSYVRPTMNSNLDPFCTELTGITQDQVENAPSFKDVHQAAEKFLERYPYPYGCIVTCGDWDLKTMLPSQCQRENVPIHPNFLQWINIKRGFKQFYGQKGYGMTDMLGKLDLPLVGRHHSGIDDARNISQIAIRMLQDGHNFKGLINKK